jgi:hypothetical protein
MPVGFRLLEKRRVATVLDMATRYFQIPFRVEDEQLVAALDNYAKSVRRSRNMAIVILLEEALALHGFWPPTADEPPAPKKRIWPTPDEEPPAPMPKKGRAKR